MSEDDVILAARVKDGDRGAFAALVDRYHGTIFRLAYRIVGEADDAADVTQATFVKAYEKFDTYNPVYRFFSWLYRIALNEALNFRQRRDRLTVLPEALVTGDPSPEETLDAAQAGDQLQKALAAMSAEQRAVLVLKHLQQMSYRDVAEILEIPEKTVKSRLFSARQALREQLERQGFRR